VKHPLPRLSVPGTKFLYAQELGIEQTWFRVYAFRKKIDISGIPEGMMDQEDFIDGILFVGGITSLLLLMIYIFQYS